MLMEGKLAHEDEVDLKDNEIVKLQGQIQRLVTTSSHRESTTIEQSTINLDSNHNDGTEEPLLLLLLLLLLDLSQMSMVPTIRRGKAPPVEPFTGEGVDTLFEEWLPTFEWVATWNNWSEPEKLLQLAGHLRGKARQEWALLDASDKSSYDKVTSALKSKLDPSRKALEVQDFLSQGRNEMVGHFIRRLEQTFRRAWPSKE